MGLKIILSTKEEDKLCNYIDLMVKWGHSIIPTQLKNKVVKIIQEKVIPFRNGNLEDYG